MRCVLLAALAGVLLGAQRGCANTDGSCQTVADVLLTTPGLDEPAGVLDIFGLLEPLDDPSLEITLFVSNAQGAVEGDLDAVPLDDPAVAAVIKELTDCQTLPTPVFASELSDGDELTTLGACVLSVSVDAGTGAISFTTEGSASSPTVIVADIPACKSVVHVVDVPLLLPGLLPAPGGDGGGYGE